MGTHELIYNLYYLHLYLYVQSFFLFDTHLGWSFYVPCVWDTVPWSMASLSSMWTYSIMWNVYTIYDHVSGIILYVWFARLTMYLYILTFVCLLEICLICEQPPYPQGRLNKLKHVGALDACYQDHYFLFCNLLPSIIIHCSMICAIFMLLWHMFPIIFSHNVCLGAILVFISINIWLFIGTIV